MVLRAGNSPSLPSGTADLGAVSAPSRLPSPYTPGFSVGVDAGRLGSSVLAQVQLLVTASASAFADRLRNEDDPLSLVDFPAFAAGEIGVRGVSLPASLLAGLTPSDLEAIRDAADKARCPALLLREDRPQPLADADIAIRNDATSRVQRLSRAASILGSAQLGISIEGKDDDERFELAASTVREAIHSINSFEVAVLLEAAPGVAGDPGRLTDLIKKIGGFRIGSLVDFRFAHDTGDFEGTLRRLAPYAGTIFATVGASASGGKPAAASKDTTPYDLEAGLKAVLAVGYQHAICLDHAGGPNAVAAMIEARETIERAISPEEDEPDPEDSEAVVGEGE